MAKPDKDFNPLVTVIQFSRDKDDNPQFKVIGKKPIKELSKEQENVKNLIEPWVGKETADKFMEL